MLHLRSEALHRATMNSKKPAGSTVCRRVLKGTRRVRARQWRARSAERSATIGALSTTTRGCHAPSRAARGRCDGSSNVHRTNRLLSVSIDVLAGRIPECTRPPKCLAISASSLRLAELRTPACCDNSCRSRRLVCERCCFHCCGVWWAGLIPRSAPGRPSGTSRKLCCHCGTYGWLPAGCNHSLWVL